MYFILDQAYQDPYGFFFGLAVLFYFTWQIASQKAS